MALVHYCPGARMAVECFGEIKENRVGLIVQAYRVVKIANEFSCYRITREILSKSMLVFK